MKLDFAFYDHIRYRKTDSPSTKERVNFLESRIRSMGVHETLCESRRPEFEDRGIFRSMKLAFPHACDCWLSEPFGTVGLRLDK